MQPRKTLQSDARRLLEVCAGWNSRVAARRITQFLDREMEGQDLSVTQLGFMAQIERFRRYAGRIGARTGLEQSTLSRNLPMLEEECLVEIAIVEPDLSRRAVWISETGARRPKAAFRLGDGRSTTDEAHHRTALLAVRDETEMRHAISKSAERHRWPSRSLRVR